MMPDMGCQERAALALWLVMQRPQTTGSLAQRLGMTREGARVMLGKLARTVPIYFDEDQAAWRLCREKEGQDETD